MRTRPRLAVRFLTAFAAVFAMAGAAFGDITATDNFTRADSATVGVPSGGQAAWVDTYSGGQILSNRLKGTVTSSNQANNSFNGSTIAGATTFNMTLATGFIAGNLLALSPGTANVEYRRIISVSTNTITVAALSNAHTSGDVVAKIRDIPILRPVSEARAYNRAEINMPALGASTDRGMVYLRWIDPGTWIGVLLNWNGSNQLTTTIQYANMTSTATIGTTGLQNWTATTSTTVHIQAVVEGTNPSVVTLKLTDLATGAALAGPTGGVYTGTITAGLDSAVQTSGQQGVGFADTIMLMSFFQTRDLTPLTVGVTDTNFQAALSPGNWRTESTSYVTTNATGAYWKPTFTGTTFVMTIDTSQWQAGAASVAVKWTIDNGAWTYAIVAPGATTISIASELATAGPHTLRWYWRQDIGGGTTNKWTADVSFWHITGCLLDHGEALTAPTLHPNILAFFTDSIGEAPQAGEVDSSPDPQLNHIASLAAYLDAEYGALSYGGTAYNATSGNAFVPPIFTPGNDAQSFWNKYDSTHSRVWTTPPNVIVYMFGTNDQLHVGNNAGITASVTGLMQATRAAFPNATIIIAEPFGHFKTAQILAGYNAAADANTLWLPMPSYTSDGLSNTGSATWASGDAIHQNLGVQGVLSSAFLGAYEKYKALATASGTARTHYRFTTETDIIFKTLTKIRRTY